MSHLFIQKAFVCLLLLLSLISSPVLLSAMCTFYNFTDFNIYTIQKRNVQLIIIQLIKNGKSILKKDPCAVLFNSMERKGGGGGIVILPKLHVLK